MRLHFIELYKSEDARELLDQNTNIIMDEAIPNPKGKDKTNLKYLDDEQILYDELYGINEENLRGEKEKALLYLFATEHNRELFEKEWGNFFLPNESLNMINPPSNYEILYKLQGLYYCRQLRTGKKFFISENNNKLPVPSERKNKRLLDNQEIRELTREYLEDLDSK
ncbi:18943_t:CDS:2 [Funneliformis geosporum]|nr:18943_t:CDS:2 [Funneliformis geosporum]